MAQTGFLSRCRKTTNIVVLASLLVIAALCFAQDANQTKVTYDEHNQPVVTQVPADPNQTAPEAAAAPAEPNVVMQSVPAQEVTSVAVVVPGKAEPNEGGVQGDVLTPLEQRLRKTVSVEFRETPIADVVRQLGAQAEVDILLSPKVIGNVTATLTDVPLDEALNNILAVQGATYIAGKNMIRIVPLGDVTMEQSKQVTKVYRIMYADVKDVATALEKFMSKSGQVSFAVGTSNIIVTDTEDKVKSIDIFIKEIDRVTPQVLVEAKIYDISCDDAIDLGIEWSAGTVTKYGTDGTGAPVGSLDKSGKTSPFTTGNVAQNTTNFTKSGADSLRFGFLNDSVNIDALIKANQKDVSAKLLANPRVLVLDNEKALIKIIQEVPYQELSQTSGGGNIGTTQFKDVGVELSVIPHITGDGLIRLKLKPTFSTKGEILSIAVPGTNQRSDVPAIDKRETDTIALVKDGETVVLGGLRKKEIHQEVSKVPLLGDLPLVGILFRFQGEQRINSELVVFVTPFIKNQQILPILSDRESKLLKQTETKMPQTNQEMLLDKVKTSDSK